MNDNLILKFELKVPGKYAASSLMELILDNVKKLPREASDNLRQLEIVLFNSNIAPGDYKTVLLRVISEEGSFAEYSRSRRWDDALSNAFDQLKMQLITPLA